MDKNYFVNIILLATISLLISACGAVEQANNSDITPITVQLPWTHASQFAGFYAAEQQGFYAEEGLEVAFIEGGPSVDRLAPVVDNNAQFSLAGGSELILGRAEGKPVRAIATIYRRSPLAFFSLEDSGITQPEDFVGKKVLVWPSVRHIFKAVMARVEIPAEAYTEIDNQPFSALLSGEVDVANGYVTSQMVEAQMAGHDLNIIYPDDYGVHS